MRRLPIFFVIDVSESMIGEPIASVAAGLRTMIQSLRQDPYSLETAYISIIVFAGKAKTLVPLTDIISFYPPQMPVGGGTSLGAVLDHLISEIDTKLVKNDGTVKGDWKPIVFLFTDGVPTDAAEESIRKWETNYRSRVNLVAISVGNNADLSLLRRLSDQVLVFNDTKPEAYKNFFKWVTASISTQSQKVENSADDSFQLDKLDDTVAFKVDLNKPTAPKTDDNCVVLNALCQQTKAPYLIKFKRNAVVDEWADIIYEEPDSSASNRNASNSDRAFILAGAFALTGIEEYRELSLENSAPLTISSGELAGNPSCPCCGNQFGFSTCACGGIHCSHGLGVNRCPWCGSEGVYGYGEGDADITRGLG